MCDSLARQVRGKDHEWPALLIPHEHVSHPVENDFCGHRQPISWKENRSVVKFAQKSLGLLVLGWTLFAIPYATAQGQKYSQWLAANGLPTDSSGDGALEANPSGDGISNLVKFALGLGAAELGYHGKFLPEQTLEGGSSYLSLRYTRPFPAPSGIAYIVKADSHLTAWNSDGVEIGNTITGDTQTLVFRDPTAISATEAKRFMRLQINVTATVPSNQASPQISGTTTIGQTLTATAGNWTDGGETPDFDYQWLRNGVPIPGANALSYQLTEVDLGARLTISVRARNIAGAGVALAADVGPVAAAFPHIVVRPDGYTAELSFSGLSPGGTYALAPDTLPKVLLSVSSPGFDDNGMPTTISRQMVGTVPLRQPYPNQTAPTESSLSGGVRITIALSDRVYAGDTVTRCALLSGAYTQSGVPSPAAELTAEAGTAQNTSTLEYAKPLANWLAFPRERAGSGSTSFPLEVLAFHRHPRAGKQVACVEFIASDEHGQTISVTSSAMVRSTRVTTGNPIAVYRAAIPLASLTQGDFITVRTKVYPFLGDASSVLDSDPSADGAPASVPSGFANTTFLNDKTGEYGTVFAYVSPTGSDATGVASEVVATASDRPFLTISAASVAVRARNNALYGRNDLGGGIVRLAAGTYSGFGSASLQTLGAGKTWFTIEASPGEGAETVTFQSGTQKNPGNWVKFRNLTLAPTAASGANATVLDAVSDGAVDGPPVIYGAYEGLKIAGLTGNAPIISRVGLRYFIGCEMTDLGRSLNASFGSNREHTPLLAGCTLSYTTQIPSGGLGTPTWTNVGNILRKGFYFTDPQATAGTAPGSTRVVPAKAAILAFNSVQGAVTTSAFGFKQATTPGGGLAIVQNVIEMITNSSSPCFSVAADGALFAMDNIVVQHMTAVGARTNYLYNDSGTSAVPKNGTLAYSILNQYNCKTDTFSNPTQGPNGVRVGNWEPHHGIGQIGNIYQTPAANGPAAPYTGPTSWNGMYLGRNVKVLGNAAFQTDRSLTGTNEGGGDYRLGTASDARNRVPAGSAVLPFDLDGTPRRNDGTGAAGAYEY